MKKEHNATPAGGMALLFMVLLNAIVLGEGLSHPTWYRMLFITVPLLLLSVISFRRM